MKIATTPWLNALILSTALTASLPTYSSVAQGSQSDWRHVDNWQSWQQVGQAQLSILFFDIYQSRLLTPSGIYQQQSFDVTPHPLALTIEYQRNISQEQLLDATFEQWLKLGFAKQDAKRWIDQLSAIFPDIKSGQTLTYVTNGSTGKFVYSPQPSQSRHIGSISDESLNDAFLSIWLSPKSEYADLRRQLIGMR
ncbi:chalcone isomerase family protein [Vibrio panuliri]|uniref:chalcone isomerase family protein n=1 Tax=Vibrio panuliri TaxID=1381081 RepID=UPI0009F9EAC2|nr:chalcone isomerase family protein [Vibrio panuliri]